MRFVVFGLGMSSSWGNGHATLWRGLVNALGRRGHSLTFYEKDVPYYASTRDGWAPPAGIDLALYAEFTDVQARVTRDLAEADVAIITSYCPDARTAAPLVLGSTAALKVFYDLDTPVTLEALRTGADVSYLPLEGLSGFDLVLSYTGGHALTELKEHLGARHVAPLYGWVDAETHRPASAVAEFRADLSYLGTFAADRQAALEEFFLKTARALPERRFALAGAQYPEHFPWTENIFFVRHLPPAQHPSFFCSGRVTLNVTRAAMAHYGFCPSGRLFEAAACGAPILTDWWQGLDTFFTPEAEILPVFTSGDVQQALSRTDTELTRMAAAARARTMQCHTAQQRVLTLEQLCDAALHATSETVFNTSIVR